MDLVRLSITGGCALASLLTIAAVAHHGQAAPLPQPMPLSAPTSREPGAAAQSPVPVEHAAPQPTVQLSSDPSYGGLSLFPAAFAATRSWTPATQRSGGRSTWAAYIDEASLRFGVPSAWISQVMRVESGGQQFLGGVPITSPKGAMGLMQVMPATYAELRARYGLGSDPYDPHDNVLAGAAYLREMYDRFGSAGFLAAYNAGPARVDDFLTRGRPLPWETQRYIADLGPRVGKTSALPLPAVTAPVQDLTATSLASRRLPTPSPSRLRPEQAPLFAGSSNAGSTDRVQPDERPVDGLFVVLTNADRRQASHQDGGNEN